MVQRTGLALIILLAMFAGTLNAQESGFVPPKLVSEAVLELPANWKETYSPLEVMILVEVKADSTVSLIKILDGKDELEAMINDLLPILAFSPALVNGKSSSSNLTLKLPITQGLRMDFQDQDMATDSLKIIDKEKLYNWINREREASDLQQIFSADADIYNRFTPQIYDTFYRTNFYMMGLNGRPYIISKDGFIQSPRIYYNSLAFQMLSNFRRVTAAGNNISFDNPRYTLPAMCTDVYAGLGDYEYNFARVQVLKNHLFGVKDFYTEFGFLVQNGWWQETISDQTSTRIFMNLPVGRTRISVNFEKYDQDIPSTSLLSGFQNGSLFSIGHKLNDLYFKWQLPWFTMGWQNEKEILSSIGNIGKQDYETKRLLFSSNLSSSITDLSVDYQYNYKRAFPDLQPLYQFTNQPEHQYNVIMQKQHKTFNYKLQSLNSEDGMDYGKALLGITGKPGKFGIFAEQNKGQTDTSVFNAVYPDSNNTVFTPAVYQYWKFAAEYSVTTRHMKLSTCFGEKTIKTNTSKFNDSLMFVNENYTKTPLFSELNVQLGITALKLDLRVEQILQWTQYKSGMYEQPELQGQTRFKVTRDMDYGNALSAGINLTGHTDYIAADINQKSVSGALVADAWAGVKITDLFEFQLMMKNLGDNIIYGLYPTPRTLIATIHWFYLN